MNRVAELSTISRNEATALAWCWRQHHSIDVMRSNIHFLFVLRFGSISVHSATWCCNSLSPLSIAATRWWINNALMNVQQQNSIKLIKKCSLIATFKGCNKFVVVRQQLHEFISKFNTGKLGTAAIGRCSSGPAEWKISLFYFGMLFHFVPFAQWKSEWKR